LAKGNGRSEEWGEGNESEKSLALKKYFKIKRKNKKEKRQSVWGGCVSRKVVVVYK
jgi:hypothetical protein